MIVKEKDQEAIANWKRVDKYWQNSCNIRFVRIPKGRFMMGSKKDESSQPIHEVKITKAFYVSIYPITQKQWSTVMGSNPSKFIGEKNPVECISWDDCQNFVKELNKRENVELYRLPTEAEWEYACRGGSVSDFFFGNRNNLLKKFAWYSDISEICHDVMVQKGIFKKRMILKEITEKMTHPVGELEPNAFGLYDIYGNVWEWCQDKWHGNYMGAPVDGGAWMDGKILYNIIRGGGWNTLGKYCTSSHRGNWNPDGTMSDIGFRLVRIE